MLNTSDSSDNYSPQRVDTLHLNPTLKIYQSIAGFTAVTSISSQSSRSIQNFFDINASGRDLLAFVNGLRTLDEIAYAYCAAAGLDMASSINWITDYFVEVGKRGLIFGGSPTPDPAMVEVGNSGILRPANLAVEVTDSCNLECGHCYLEASPRKRSHMSYVDFEKLVKAFHDNCGLSIELTGGEFFMNPDWKSILELSLQEFSRVGILTNGTIIPESAVNLLRHYKNQAILSISLDSVQPELHNRLRGKPKAYEHTIRNIGRLTAAGIKIRLASVIFDENMWEIHKLAQFALDIGAEIFSFNFVEDFGRGKNFKSDHSIAPNLGYKEYIQKTLQDFSDLIPIITGERVLNRLNCGAGSAAVAIDSRGFVRPCVLFPRTKIFGNVFDCEWGNFFDAPIHQILALTPAPGQDHGCQPDCPHSATCGRCILKGLKQNVNSPLGERCSWVTSNNLDNVVNFYLNAINHTNSMEF